MERVRLVALLVGIAAVAGFSAAFLLVSWIPPPPSCPLEFHIQPLNTSAGWFYVIVDLRGASQPLISYDVTFFVFASGSAGDQ